MGARAGEVLGHVVWSEREGHVYVLRNSERADWKRQREEVAATRREAGLETDSQHLDLE